MAPSALSEGLANVFSYDSLVHAIAGSTGGATAITMFFPLNQIRVALQVAIVPCLCRYLAGFPACLVPRPARG